MKGTRWRARGPGPPAGPWCPQRTPRGPRWTVPRAKGSFPYQRPPDDELLDLAGPLVDAEQADVPVDALDGHPAHVPEAAVDLHRPVRGPADHLGAEQLRHRRPDPAVLAGVEPLRGREHQRPAGV